MTKQVTKGIIYYCPGCGKELPEKMTVIPICYGPTEQDYLDALKYMCCGDPKCINGLTQYIKEGVKYAVFYTEVPSKVTYYE